MQEFFCLWLQINQVKYIRLKACLPFPWKFPVLWKRHSVKNQWPALWITPAFQKHHIWRHVLEYDQNESDQRFQSAWCTRPGCQKSEFFKWFCCYFLMPPPSLRLWCMAKGGRSAGRSDENDNVKSVLFFWTSSMASRWWSCLEESQNHSPAGSAGLPLMTVFHCTAIFTGAIRKIRNSWCVMRFFKKSLISPSKTICCIFLQEHSEKLVFIIKMKINSTNGASTTRPEIWFGMDERILYLLSQI